MWKRQGDQFGKLKGVLIPYQEKMAVQEVRRTKQEPKDMQDYCFLLDV